MTNDKFWLRSSAKTSPNQWGLGEHFKLLVIMEMISLKFIGVGLCSIGMAGAAIAIGNIFGSFFNSLARNPSAAPKIEKYIYIAVGLAEAMGIFAVLLAFLVMFSS